MEISKGDDSTDAIISVRDLNKGHKIRMIVMAVFNFLGFAGIIVAYFVMIAHIDTQLSEATQVQ